MTIDTLLETECWIIDILPAQVPHNSAGQYFAVEQYYLSPDRFADIKQRHINVVLKLNCYRDVSLDDDPELNPSPEAIDEAMRSQQVFIRIGDAMILSDTDSTYLTLFNPEDELLELVTTLAGSEGLFVWKP